MALAPAARNRLILAAFVVTTLLSLWIALGASSPEFGGAAVKGARFVAVILIAMESLPALACIWLGAAGLGWPLQRVLWRDTGNGVVIPTALGLGALLMGWWLLALAGVLSAWTGWGVPLIGVALLLGSWYRGRALKLPPIGIRLPWELLLIGPPAGMLLAAAAAPPGTLWRVEAFAYDVTSYHLQIPREWLDAGAMIPLRHNVYSFLPGLVESAYAHIAAMHGGMVEAIYTAQLFHASLALFAAAAVGTAVMQLASARAGVFAAAALLATPWLLVTGSLAYNEMGVLAFGAAALVAWLTPDELRLRRAVTVGLFLGLATLAKPTAGPMLAVPLGLLLLTRPLWSGKARAGGAWRAAMLTAAAAGIAGMTVLAPYLLRNLAWTGNPVFPFATQILGQGHWDASLAERWDRAHGLAWNREPRFEALDRQFLRNAGYGALGGQPAPRETRNIARFDREGGIPILWLAVAASAAGAMTSPRLRGPAASLCALLAMQLAFWLLGTHLQSRFLIVTLLPASLLLGLGFAQGVSRAATSSLSASSGAAAALAGVFIAALAAASLSMLASQTRPLVMDNGVVRPPLYAWVDTLEDAARHTLDELPAGSRALLVADNMGLLYIDSPFTYNTAFDRNPLGDVLRETAGDPEGVAAALRSRGVTHVWINWSELDRLSGTYGFDPRVTPSILQEMGSNWARTQIPPAVTLYRVPPHPHD